MGSINRVGWSNESKYKMRSKKEAKKRCTITVVVMPTNRPGADSGLFSCLQELTVAMTP